MRTLRPALLVLASCGLSYGGAVPPEKRNIAKPLPEFSAARQLPKNSSGALIPLYKPYSTNTPKFQNEALIQHLSDHPGARLDHLDPAELSLGKRQQQDAPVGT